MAPMTWGSFAMCCEEYKHLIGRFLDDEVAPVPRAEFADHLQTCAACSRELATLTDLTSEISVPREPDVPSDLWDSIERVLATAADGRTGGGSSRFARTMSRPWALAASVLFVAGLGLLSLSILDTSAKASTINFGVLLDALPLDAQGALRKFLVHYDARPGSPTDARKFAPSLSFETPPTLPGGFHLDKVYLLRFGDRPGVAATYKRGGEFLAAIFHTPVKDENYGTHEDYPCVVGKHHGHKVEVGAWKMVHLTDPTTCHCVLSQLDELSELPAVMAAVAPSASGATHAREHRHR